MVGYCKVVSFYQLLLSSKFTFSVKLDIFKTFKISFLINLKYSNMFIIGRYSYFIEHSSSSAQPSLV